MKCYRCGKTLEAGAKFCSQCGASQDFSAQQIDAAKAGDQAAITDLYNRTYNNVYLEVKALIPDEDTVLDIVQDSYLKSFTHLQQLEDPSKYRAWVKRIAHNNAIDHLRKHKPVVFSEMVAFDSDEAIEVEDIRTDSRPDIVMEDKERRELLDEMLNSLPAEQRAVVVMRVLDNMSFAEVAGELGISESTAKSRFAYGIKKLNGKAEDLKKKGYKLYSFTGLPLLLLLLGDFVPETSANAAANTMLSLLEKTGSEGAKAGVAGVKAAAGAGKAAATVGTTAGKVLSTKLIAGIVAAAVLVGAGGTGAYMMKQHNDEKAAAEAVETVVAESEEGSQTESEAENAEDTNTGTEQLTEKVDEIVAFQPVVAEYAKAIGEDYFDMNEYPDMSTSAIINYLGYGRETGMTFNYAYYDIDDNGTLELLIGIEDSRGYEVVDIYALEGNEPQRLFTSSAYGDRASLRIFQTGEIEEHGSNGANDDFTRYYVIGADGCSLQSVDGPNGPEVEYYEWFPLEPIIVGAVVPEGYASDEDIAPFLGFYVNHNPVGDIRLDLIMPYAGELVMGIGDEVVIGYRQFTLVEVQVNDNVLTGRIDGEKRVITLTKNPDGSMTFQDTPLNPFHNLIFEQT